MQRILIVEDDLDIQELLKNFLQEVGYAVTLASDGIEAISLFASTHFDLILLDIMLPKIDGFTVCELIRKQSRVPIIMLTALNGEEEQIRGLDLQVDDYITKPFSMPILVRKIGAVLRRSSMIPEQEHQTITYKNLVLDMDSYTINVCVAVNTNFITEFTAKKLVDRHVIRFARQIPERNFNAADAACLSGRATKLLDFVENTVNITGILSEQTALEHESIGFAGSIPYLAVTNQSLIGHQFENRTAFRRTVNIDETHIRNTQCARVNRRMIHCISPFSGSQYSAAR